MLGCLRTYLNNLCAPRDVNNKQLWGLLRKLPLLAASKLCDLQAKRRKLTILSACIDYPIVFIALLYLRLFAFSSYNDRQDFNIKINDVQKCVPGEILGGRRKTICHARNVRDHVVISCRRIALDLALELAGSVLMQPGTGRVGHEMRPNNRTDGPSGSPWDLIGLLTPALRENLTTAEKKQAYLLKKGVIAEFVAVDQA
ncbi:hypothetical protein PoB_005009600 [Plakobranchus ocellatus]|uniref:Uncharacterized protein n=1 Tax=Plakobranchus ocellatus TaxID=259542 RepID=A0AAV4BJT7_9GAST|nr:hypothetical protein PoB_005009600 [Plakobranchus ocellatus]